MPRSAVAALMRGHALTAVKHFHRALRQPCLDLLTDQSVRDRIEEPGNFDVVVDPDPGKPPFGELAARFAMP